MNESEKTKEIWETHYNRDKSKLAFPDENLVRIVSRLPHSGKALDFGTGPGRHAFYLESLGFQTYACDYAENAIQDLKRNSDTIQFFHVQTPPYPLPDQEFDLVLAWGVLHYNPPEMAAQMVNEFKRIGKKDGFLIGTIRSDQDTFLQTQSNSIGTQDLEGGYIRLYSLEETKDLLSPFRDLQIGYMERTRMGQLDQRICHWIFQCRF